VKNKKSLGQHWLKDREILAEIADYGAAVADEKTAALEIGPGLGTLTSVLVGRFPRVVAVEFDEELAAKLPKQFVGANLEVVRADFLTFDLTKMQDYVVVANIPYYITAKIIQKLVEADKPPKRAVLLVQKEVAERIADGKKSSLLSLMVAERAKATLGVIVGREHFTPPPKVDSQVLILDFGQWRLAESERKQFWRAVKAGFSSPRKKLQKNLGAIAAPEKIAQAFLELGISDNARAEDLTFSAWQKLAKRLV